jgi:hypothetical protein
MPYLIVPVCNPSLAIQGGAAQGQTVTLQKLNAQNPLQLWDDFFQFDGSTYGLAFLQLNMQTQSALCINANGLGNALTMVPFAFGQGPTAFFIINTQGAVRLAWTQNTQLSFNDWTAGCKPGDVVALNNDTNQNSLWKLQFVTPE